MEINEIILSIFLNLAKYQFWLSKSHFKIGKNLNSEFDIFKYFSLFYYFFLLIIVRCVLSNLVLKGGVRFLRYLGLALKPNLVQLLFKTQSTHFFEKISFSLQSWIQFLN